MNKIIIVYFKERERAAKYDSKELVRAISRNKDNMEYISVIFNEVSLVSLLMRINSACEYRYNAYNKSEYLIVTDTPKDLPTVYMDGFSYINIDDYIKQGEENYKNYYENFILTTHPTML